MNITFLIILAAALFFVISMVEAREIGFIEDFSLARDRSKALEKLTPGTSDYYYYHCLNAQHNGDFKQVETLLERWIKREGDSERTKEIINRQALLEYEQNPSRTLKYIQKELHLRFDHRKASAETKAQYPFQLNPKRIDAAVLMDKALKRRKDLGDIEDQGLALIPQEQLNPRRRLDLLKRLRRPVFPNLVQLVVDELNDKHSRGFGSLPIHALMLQSQLDQCLRLKPELMDNTAFIHAYMAKLAPSDDIDLRHDPDEKQAYLERLWRFTQKLAPAHNSLKAHVLFHLLDLKRRRGEYDDALFRAYPRLPRKAFYVEPAYLKKHSFQGVEYADIKHDFTDVTGMPAIITDEALVRDYLMRAFTQADDYSCYSPYIKDDYLKKVFAETKIVNGLGDMEKWSAMMAPQEHEALRERIDLEFAPSNPEFFDRDDPVRLELYVKNVQNLIVRIFEINTFNYYRDVGEEVDAGVDLDGLASTWEQAHTYDEPPSRRVRRQFDLTQINRPGVFVVEFIGAGKSSRAVIRKGRLYAVDRIGAAGHEFIIRDERNQRRPDAVIWMGGREYRPDENGVVTIPYSTKPGRRNIILKADGFCSLAHFDHQAESYQLTAGFHVDREALVPNNLAQVIVRPVLTLNGYPISLDLLEQTRLIIKSYDMWLVAVESEVNDFKIREAAEAVHAFRVPENPAVLCFTLKAQVHNISRDKTEHLRSALFGFSTINEINPPTLATEGLHLRRSSDGCKLALYGKNGGPRPFMPVQVEMKHRFFRPPVIVNLQTDDQGAIQLGHLGPIERIEAEAPNGDKGSWIPCHGECQYPQNMHYPAHALIRIPYIDENENHDKPYCLLEKRGATYLADHTDRIANRDGFLEIEGLPAGDHELFLKQKGVSIQLRLTEGPVDDGVVVSNHRILEQTNAEPLTIASIAPTESRLEVRLGNASTFTRLHVMAVRFDPAYNPFCYLVYDLHPEPFVQTRHPVVSHYMGERDIGDEHRYILDRQYAVKYPGNMLKRPELLLNPWRLRSTTTVHDYAQKGEPRMHRRPEVDGGKSTTGVDDFGDHVRQPVMMSVDFLAQPSKVLVNLKPNAEGVVTIDRKPLEGYAHLLFLAVDPFNTVYREFLFPETPVITKDLRQQASPEADIHLTEQRKMLTLQPGQTLRLDDAGASSYQIYDSLERLYHLLLTLSKNDDLEKFAFILKWPDMDAEEKAAQYSKHACHELNFFLYHKDRAFFDRVLKPYLENKKDPTFLDHWLLNHDSSAFLEPWAFEGLNIVEKILLHRRGPGDADEIIAYVDDCHDLITPDIEHENFIFETALQGRALETDRIDSKEVVQKEKGFGHAPRAASAPHEAQPSSRVIRSPQTKQFFAPARRKQREASRPFFRQLDKTKEWAENNYYNIPIENQNADLIKVNAFWRDYAHSNPQQPFYSPYIMHASNNFAEMMLALAVSDLPFTAHQHDVQSKDRGLRLKAGGPLIVYYKEVRSASEAEDKFPLLASQHYFDPNDLYRYDGAERTDKYIQGEFLVNHAYGCRAVFSNPTSAPRKLEALFQIPQGALPLAKGFYTRGMALNIKRYATQTHEYHFYFPQVGVFNHYPVQVAHNGAFIAAAEPSALKVVAKFSHIDKQSWDYISQNGADADVLAYLRNENLNRVDLEKIAFRMRDRGFCEDVLALLQKKHYYNDLIWSYSIHHHLKTNIRTFLQHSEYADRCGLFIDSPLLTLDPVARRAYQHLEYKPLVNARAHLLGQQRKILNDRLYDQYHRLLTYLSYRPELKSEDLLAVCYYLLLQDRAPEAIAFFERIDPERLASRLQYDYIRAYIGFYTSAFDEMRAIAGRYTDYPVMRWRKRFQQIIAQLDEIEGVQPQTVDRRDRDEMQTHLADETAALDFKIEARQVTIRWQNVQTCQINYYPMDIELLFSKNPFVREHKERFAYIRPNLTQTIELDPCGSNDSSCVKTVELPAQYKNSNLMVEIVAEGILKTRVYFANSLFIQVTENYGLMKVDHADTHRPLAGVYVKVYARMKGGDARFYKDGYTDWRGRFDYASLSTDDLDQVSRFAILALSDEYGAEILETPPPQQ